mmetsp:Transcript_14748/g.50775  ORF Transcript_14748/g.50775 Transcript_14748/m.50775 type:complete len:293 (-) Transcript_14748:1119-1997(-)
MHPQPRRCHTGRKCLQLTKALFVMRSEVLCGRASAFHWAAASRHVPRSACIIVSTSVPSSICLSTPSARARSSASSVSSRRASAKASARTSSGGWASATPRAWRYVKNMGSSRRSTTASNRRASAKSVSGSASRRREMAAVKSRSRKRASSTESSSSSSMPSKPSASKSGCALTLSGDVDGPAAASCSKASLSASWAPSTMTWRNSDSEAAFLNDSTFGGHHNVLDRVAPNEVRSLWRTCRGPSHGEKASSSKTRTNFMFTPPTLSKPSAASCAAGSTYAGRLRYVGRPSAW